MPHTHFTTLISAANLGERLDAAPESVFIADCRFELADPTAGERAYAAGHLPGAHYLHLDRDLSGPKSGGNGRHPLPDRETLARNLAARGLKKGQQVITYDAQGGTYAARLWWLLRWLGHDSVAVLDGGLAAWTETGRALVGEVPAETPGDFAAAAPLAVTIDVAAVERNLQSRERLIVDARAADRYRGENETIDPVGGHIPGALNRPFMDNLQPDGRFKSAHELREAFHAVLGPIAPERAVMQCGSGVTACHNLLAMEVAGLHGAALYGGSWSEWCASPLRPVAIGSAA
ncbi:sulfurtransferase [Pararobbsia alpina]|uniref:Thiosulfate sulfurtransferase SseB n=1 Tax=Pararobbsia alpina TaxID=621374 RepID=A0A6S7CD11_9BURK|nr:sulfurtransferase [Pararobbsia alpina]CAB3786672.1 Putative thiosulfate sulfurtransferase SseB [Pararobbsia alpina]